MSATAAGNRSTSADEGDNTALGRTAPGLSGQSDYKPFFKVLKSAGYAGGISVEASDGAKIVGREAEILKYIKDNWEAA